MTDLFPGEAESFATLLARYADDSDCPPEIHRASLTAVLLGSEDDPLRVLSYLTGLGIAVNRLDDVFSINADDTEDSLHAFAVTEGVAISIAGDGLWVLLTP